MITLLRDLLLRDFWLKLFSLALAVLIWLTVSIAIRKEVPPSTLTGSKVEELTYTYFNIPVAVLSTAADPRSFKVNPSEVEVTVRADPKLLQDVHTKDIEPYVDLRRIESAARGVHVRIDVMRPPGITEVRVNPPEVEVIVPPRH